MKNIWSFLKTTLIGGFLFLLPVAFTVFLLEKAGGVVLRLIRPLIRRLPFESTALETILAVLILVSLAFLAGLSAKTSLGKSAVGWLENGILRLFPGYTLYKTLAKSAGDKETCYPAALGYFGDGNWQLCLIIEQHENGYKTVYAPSAPNPTSGNVSVLPSDQVLKLDVPINSLMNCMRQIGVGSGRMIEGWGDAMAKLDQKEGVHAKNAIRSNPL